MKIIRQREHVTHYIYCREFMDKDNDGGYSFHCKENGELLPMTKEAKANYDKCLQGVFTDLVDRGIVEYEQSYVEPAVGICDHCKTEVTLEDQYYGACQCPKCGQWYNLFGQQLLDPKFWEEPLDDNY